MADLSNIIKVTQTQYNTLINGGSITKGGVTYTYDANAMYLVENSGGDLDVQVNGSSIVSGGVANLVTNSTYNASSNKIATMSDMPTIMRLN